MGFGPCHGACFIGPLLPSPQPHLHRRGLPSGEGGLRSGSFSIDPRLRVVIPFLIRTNPRRFDGSLCGWKWSGSPQPPRLSETGKFALFVLASFPMTRPTRVMEGLWWCGQTQVVLLWSSGRYVMCPCGGGSGGGGGGHRVVYPGIFPWGAWGRCLGPLFSGALMSEEKLYTGVCNLNTIIFWYLSKNLIQGFVIWILSFSDIFRLCCNSYSAWWF